MEELQKIIDWIGEYDKEYECFPHPNLIKMRMKLRVEELQKQVNVPLGSVIKTFTAEQLEQAHDVGFHNGCEHARPTY